MNVPSQWETILHCNVISHWLGTYTKRSSNVSPLMYIIICGANALLKPTPISHTYIKPVMWYYKGKWQYLNSLRPSSKLTIIGSDNSLSPGRRQAIIWTNDGILLIGALGTNFSEILIEVQIFSFWKNRLKVSSVKWRAFCVGLNELTNDDLVCWHMDVSHNINS